MDFGALFAPISAWLDAHPGAVAWALGWVAALSAAQTVKQILPHAWSTTAAKRMLQIVAMGTGAIVSYVLWPRAGVDRAHVLVDALIVGMSAPTAYTFLKAVIEVRWPRLAEALSWEAVRDRNGPPPSCGAPPP
jgi:hypothetical protein